MRKYQKAFRDSEREANFCNWCGTPIVNLLIHHGDGEPTNNDPNNLWALCSQTCHMEVHKKLLDWEAKHDKRNKDPKRREKVSKAVTKRWEDPSERKKQSDSMLGRRTVKCQCLVL